jgi:hypothetical protein
MIALTQKVLYTVNMCTVYGNNRFLVIDDNDHDGTIYIHVSHKNPSPGKQRDSLEVLGFQIFVKFHSIFLHIFRSDVYRYVPYTCTQVCHVCTCTVPVLYGTTVHTHNDSQQGGCITSQFFFYV